MMLYLQELLIYLNKITSLSPSSFTLFSLPFPEYMKDYHILGNCPYGADLAKQLATMLRNILWSCGSIRISFSRRTPEKVYML